MDLTWTNMDIVEDSEPAPGKFQLLYLLFYSFYWLEKSSNLPHRFYVFKKIFARKQDVFSALLWEGARSAERELSCMN